MGCRVGDKGVCVLMVAKSSDRLDIFTPLLVESLQTFTISSGIETPFGSCCRSRAFGDSRGDGVDDRGYFCNKG